MSQNGKLMPNLDQHSTKLLNLTVLQRIHPFVEEILITAAFVSFYEFNIDLSQWSRKAVEVCLFVVKKNTQLQFQFIVINPRNSVLGAFAGRFVYPVSSNAHCEVTNNGQRRLKSHQYLQLITEPLIHF
ncbi:hypothetical protein S245_009319, partial [Arachis hypogaea]